MTEGGGKTAGGGVGGTCMSTIAAGEGGTMSLEAMCA